MLFLAVISLKRQTLMSVIRKKKLRLYPVSLETQLVFVTGGWVRPFPYELCQTCFARRVGVGEQQQQTGGKVWTVIHACVCVLAGETVPRGSPVTTLIHCPFPAVPHIHFTATFLRSEARARVSYNVVLRPERSRSHVFTTTWPGFGNRDLCSLFRLFHSWWPADMARCDAVRSVASVMFHRWRIFS